MTERPTIMVCRGKGPPTMNAPINSEGLQRLSWRLNCAIGEQVMDSDARRILGAIADDFEAALKASLPTPVIDEGLVEKVAILMRGCDYDNNDGSDKITADAECEINFNELARAAIAAMAQQGGR